MFHFELALFRPNHEEYTIYLPAGVPRPITAPVRVDASERQKYQEVGHLIICRSGSEVNDKSADHIYLIVHPELNEEERAQLVMQVEGLCGKHCYTFGNDEFEPMLFFHDALTQ